MLAPLVERGAADERASRHRLVILRAGQAVMLPGLHDREPGAALHRLARPDRSGPEADAVADVTGVRTAEAERDRDAVGGLARRDPHRRADAAAAKAQLDHVLARHAEPLRGGGRHQRGVVPGELRERAGQLEQPAVVRELAVEDVGIGPEGELDAVLGGR
jgi:hypothetical protein